MVSILLAVSALAVPVIDPLSAVTLPAGKSLIIPITATVTNGRPLTYTITSSTNGIGVVLHTNNPFWQLTVAQLAASNAPGAYATPFRGGTVTVTNVGSMTFMLFPEYAPHTANVFQGLTTAGFYNSNTIFHRVVANFVIQGGDPQTNGFGGLSFQYEDEFHPQAMFTGNGQLALANSGKDTDGAQFFVTVGPHRNLDFGYTLFGQLVRGFGVLSNIDATAVDANSRPLADEVIQAATYVADTADTVVTLTATNVVGVTGTITVIADDGAGGRATNSFIASAVADTGAFHKPFIYPNTATNLVGPANQTLTNFISAVELDGDSLSWYGSFVTHADSTNAPNSSFNQLTNRLLAQTYNVTNVNGVLELFVVPATNYVGPVRLLFEPYYGSAYDEQYYTFVFGDTPITGTAQAVSVLTGAFTNVVLATFTNGVPGSPATNFTASINWGDNAINNGIVATNASGFKTVLGAHTYRYPGIYPVYVTVQSSIGASATMVSYVTAVARPPVLSLDSQALKTNALVFDLQFATGLTGQIQFSSNLITWNVLTNFIGTNATLSFKDPAAATNASRRFYRAVIP